MRVMYLLLALIGAALPYSQFVPWLARHGLDVPLMLSELFSTRMGAFFGLDVIVSATCLVGVSCGLPLFLYLRERALATT